MIKIIEIVLSIIYTEGGIQKEKRDLRKKELQDFFFSREEDLATFFVIYTIRSELRTKG